MIGARAPGGDRNFQNQKFLPEQLPGAYAYSTDVYVGSLELPGLHRNRNSTKMFDITQGMVTSLFVPQVNKNMSNVAKRKEMHMARRVCVPGKQLTLTQETGLSYRQQPSISVIPRYVSVSLSL